MFFKLYENQRLRATHELYYLAFEEGARIMVGLKHRPSDWKLYIYVALRCRSPSRQLSFNFFQMIET